MKNATTDIYVREDLMKGICLINR